MQARGAGSTGAVVLLGLALATGSAAAEEPADPVQPFLTAGLVEVIGLGTPPQHLGLYVTVSLDVGIVLSEEWMLIPSFGFEFAPEFGNWGGTFFLILDRFLAETGGVVLTLEPQLGLLHDAAPLEDGGFDHALYLAGALGLAVITERATVIPQVGVSTGLAGEGWALFPTLLFSVPF